MFKWLKRSRELILAEADEFMEAYGNKAYWKIREEQREARKNSDRIREKFLGKVALEVAKRTDFAVGLDTATRYLEEKQTPYDFGPGRVIGRPANTTLH